MPPVDLFIIGGGVNGCGIARDAAGRGLSVCLAEKDDLASKTSSGSTKLVHGGLRYLEYYEFDLVRKALKEREVLWRLAPHIIYPMRFVLPHVAGMRPRWLLRLGLFIYDHLGGRKDLPPTRSIAFSSDPAGDPLKSEIVSGFEYSDCWVDDARLTVLNARDAADRGATVLTRQKVVRAERENGVWVVHTEMANGERQQVRARILVNAAGPWVSQLAGSVIDDSDKRKLRLVRGSHIVVNKLFEHEQSYILQNPDGRIVFVIPYEKDFTLIGTTDADHDESLEQINIGEDEKRYLCESVSRRFEQSVGTDDIVWSYSAVRPLFDDGKSDAKSVTRDYQIVTEASDSGAPLISVLGGKITTYRKLAEDVLREVERFVPDLPSSWSATQSLPGGDFDHQGFEQQVRRLKVEYPFLSDGHASRLTRLYGTRARQLLDSAKGSLDLGRLFGSDLYEVEVRYLIDQEWALSAEDILWRRTKEGLRLSSDQAQALDAFVKEVVGA
ncbi:MAG: glycerol-3-phosphate dehydrogenase [Gammaproteobacteria bacterium]|nr:glycerol-3-phosphate dehydrogenase [Gammaproteobacteria bacterium]